MQGLVRWFIIESQKPVREGTASRDGPPPPYMKAETRASAIHYYACGNRGVTVYQDFGGREKMTKIAPSILSADFSCLIRDINDVKQGGAEYLHVDVMDGIFVPNITIGIPVVKSLRKATDMFMDVHLMIDRPHRYVKDFCSAGADLVVFHIEADQPQDVLDAIKTVKDCGKNVGLAIKPKTPAETIIPYLPMLDLVLVMTVEPGFGGQSFMHDQLPKISSIREMIEKVCPECELEVDGGIDATTAKLCKDAGANVLAAGSAVFAKEDRKQAIEAIRNA